MDDIPIKVNYEKILKKNEVINLLNLLTKEQRIACKGALKYIIKIYNTPYNDLEYDYDEFVISGFAGTGKTYLIQTLFKILKKIKIDNCYKVMSFTGKAVNNLRKKMISADTMHSLLYSVEKDKNGAFIGFEFKGTSEEVKFIIYDEYSMLPSESLNDLKRNNIPVLYFGDFFQLPPVKEDRTDIYKNTKYFLTKLQRSNGPTTNFATSLRNNQGLPFSKIFKKDDLGRFFGLTFKEDRKNWWTRLLDFDKIVVGTNKYKDTINTEVRKRLGRNSWKPVVGDKLMCIKNFRDENGSLLASNGEDFELIDININNILKDGNRTATMKLQSDSGAIIKFENVCYDYFDKTKKINISQAISNQSEFQDMSFFDYSYACTCHKLQGSECNKILVLAFDMTWMNDELANIIYTALTREKLGTILVMKKNQYIFNKLFFNPKKFKVSWKMVN